MASFTQSTSLLGIKGLEGKCALVTGASGSIGSACCRFLADDGLKLVLVDLNQKKLDDMAKNLNTKCLALAFDISNADVVKENMEAVHGGYIVQLPFVSLIVQFATPFPFPFLVLVVNTIATFALPSQPRDFRLISW